PYLINGDEIEFDIADDAETQPLTVVRISDERATGLASIVKRCADDACPWCEEGNAIEGARFIVVAMEDILNPSGSVDMPKGATVELDPTDESGVARIDGLPLGSEEPLDMRSSRSKLRRTHSRPHPHTLHPELGQRGNTRGRHRSDASERPHRNRHTQDRCVDGAPWPEHRSMSGLDNSNSNSRLSPSGWPATKSGRC
ncbi:MAG: collagen binding domain-containing protein, partial [Collinsella intestinalis]